MNNIGPFLPQLQRYQKPGVKLDPPLNPQQPLQMLHQPIPSIVVNPLANSESQSLDSQSYYQPLNLPGPHAQNRSKAPVGSVGSVGSMPVFNSLSQPPQSQRPILQGNNYQLPYGSLHNQPSVYYMPPSQMYPQYRPQMVFPDGYLGMPPIKPLGELPSISQAQNFPVRQPGSIPPPLHLTPSPSLYLPGQSGQPEVRAPHLKAVNYKPVQTKKNSRPTIKKINSDSHEKRNSRKRSRISIEEPNFDTLYNHFKDVLGISLTRKDIAEKCTCVLQDELEKTLFELFADNLAMFIDVYLAHDVFQKIVTELALGDESRMILDSMFCLSSLILQRTRPNDIDPLCPLKYYQQTVNSIRFHLSLPQAEDPDSGILARCLLSTCLLCIYELFFVAVDSTYNKGAASILMSILSKNLKGESLLKTSPFYESCFWAMFMCDMVLSMKLQMPSMYSVTKVWRPLDPEFFENLDNYTAFEDDAKTIKDAMNNHSSFVVSRKNTIWWQHKILLLFCNINEFLHLTDVITQEDLKSNKRFHIWHQLSSKLDEFERNMPVSMKPLIHMPCSVDRVFPLIYFKDEHAAIAALHFKLSKLAIIESLYVNVAVENTSLLEPEFAKFPTSLREKLSKDILGILQTYDSNKSIWPVNVHSVRQASRCIQEGTPEHNQLKVLANRVLQFSHAALKLLVLNDG